MGNRLYVVCDRKTAGRYLHSIGGAEREAMLIFEEAFKESHKNLTQKTIKGSRYWLTP